MTQACFWAAPIYTMTLDAKQTSQLPNQILVNQIILRAVQPATFLYGGRVGHLYFFMVQACDADTF